MTNRPASLVRYNTQEFVPDPGRRFWIVMTPLLGLIALANLVTAWRARGGGRSWWLIGSLLTLTVVVSTFTYFVPGVLRFQRATDPAAVADLAADVQLWVRLNWVRAFIYIVGWLSALKALSFGPATTRTA